MPFGPGLVIRRQLLCPVCGTLLADAAYRRLPPNLTLRAADGTIMQPTSAAVLLAQLQPGARSEDPRARYVEQNLGELVYELRCVAGHQMLRTMPEIVRRIRTARGHGTTV
ncbi:hypothetical protein [Pseudonocardia sp. D17]|uniref:hypothetical protein n=1 Tax=Pseudonocardia sp. D17 TaxID=882661 RepID=UPI002B3B9A1E|nr:hypothetical protein PSD17_51820 [Pseudonocardia sp. D17]